MRQQLTIQCEGDSLAATLDSADGTTGLLIVSGGNETRIGAHRGMALLAARLATRGVPVFRFDRRGVGDSTGANTGYAGSQPDLAAAARAFAAETGVSRLVGFGNCDAATALALFGSACGIDALILTNPWLGHHDALPPPAAIRARYAERVRDPATWRRLMQGSVDLRQFAKGLRRLAADRPQRDPIAVAVAAGLAAIPTTVILAATDATALAFAAARIDVATVTIPTTSHSFAGFDDELEEAIVAALARYSAA